MTLCSCQCHRTTAERLAIHTADGTQNIEPLAAPQHASPGRDLTDAEVLTFAKFLVGAAGSEYSGEATAQLAKAVVRLERMRPVVEAAEAWRDDISTAGTRGVRICDEDAVAAIDAYRSVRA